MPFLGRNKDLATAKQTCLNGPSYLQLCPTPFIFMWLIPEGTLWKCKKCETVYYLDKHLPTVGGDTFTKWKRFYDHTK